VGQSSSVPSSRPIRCSRGISTEPRQMVSELVAPGRPVVDDVVAPQIELVRDALLGEQAGEVLRALESAGRVLPGALAADQQQVDVAPQPLEMVAVQMADVVERLVEVAGLAALAPSDDR